MLENQPLMGILPICHDTKRQNARIFRSLSLFSPFLNYHDFTEPLMGSILISLIMKWRKIKKFIHQVPAIQTSFQVWTEKIYWWVTSTNRKFFHLKIFYFVFLCLYSINMPKKNNFCVYIFVIFSENALGNRAYSTSFLLQEN